MLKTSLSMSERLACKAVGLARSTYRRLPLAQTPADPDAEMRAWLRAYATKHPCHGFRRAWAALRYGPRVFPYPLALPLIDVPPIAQA